jgi:4-oxalocrotonate tautomerase
MLNIKIGTMPHVTVKMYPGCTHEQKSKLAQEITNAIMKIAQKPESAISIAIEEVTEAEWMAKVYDTEIRANMEKLYKKPGY